MERPAASPVAFALRNGQMCVLGNDAVSVGATTIPLANIISASLVADLSVPVAPGLPPTPAVALRARDGADLTFTPVEQLDCWRFLESLFAMRPELASPLPPPPGGSGGFPPPQGSGGFPPPQGSGGYPPPGGGYGAPGYGYPGYGYPGYGYAGYAPFGPTETERVLAGICHLSVFFAPVILPLIIWLAMSSSQPYASRQAKQAFFFHLGFTVISLVASVGLWLLFMSTIFSTAGAAVQDPTTPPIMPFAMIPLIFIGYGVILVLSIVNIVYSIIGAVQAFQGKPFHYPLLGRL